MNGRIYDPKLGRMLQADPFIQSPTNSQSLNRYSYVLNNPLSYTDPSGYFFSRLWKKWVRPIAAIAITAVGMAFAPYLAPVWGALSGWIATGNFQGALMGAFSSIVFSGIGNAFASVQAANAARGIAGLTALQTGAKALAHGIAGGIMSMMSGGKFGHGFAAAGFTQSLGGRIGAVDAQNAGFSIPRTMVAAVVGGTVSELTGGKFANGAITGAFSRAFNDEQHGVAHAVRKFISGLNQAVDVQVSAGAQVGIKTSIPGGAKVQLMINGLAAEKELTDSSNAIITREFGAAVGVPFVGDFSISRSETNVLDPFLNDFETTYGFREFSMVNEGSATLSFGVAAGLGINLDIHLDRIYHWYKTYE